VPIRARQELIDKVLNGEFDEAATVEIRDRRPHILYAGKMSVSE